MSMPPNTLRLLQGAGSAFAGQRTSDHPCEGSKFHSPRPLLVNPVTVEGKRVWLCGTCHGNLSVLTTLLETNEGELTWETRREFGVMIRSIAARIWLSRGLSTPS